MQAIKLGNSDTEQQELSTAAMNEIKAWNREHVRDMELAWQIIDGIEPEDGDAARQLFMFQLDIAQRGKNSVRMLHAYNNLRDISTLQPEEEMAVFMVSPLLGLWNDTIELGNKVSQYQSWEEFHQLALQRANIPDYSILYQLANKYTQQGNMQLEQQSWNTMDVVYLKTSMHSYSGMYKL